MTKGLKLFTLIFLYLLGGFILYVLTCEYSFFFLLYKLIYGLLFPVVLYQIYKYYLKNI